LRPEEIQLIKAPALLIIGDADVVRPEHVVQMFRLLGGGVAGDLVGLPASQLAVLPGTTHVSLIERTDWLLSMVSAFLDAPMPKAK
jgi:pimeloyl-ACP methyl ester carboxylesterase